MCTTHLAFPISWSGVLLCWYISSPYVSLPRSPTRVRINTHIWLNHLLCTTSSLWGFWYRLRSDLGIEVFCDRHIDKVYLNELFCPLNALYGLKTCSRVFYIQRVVRLCMLHDDPWIWPHKVCLHSLNVLVCTWRWATGYFCVCMNSDIEG